ncbi:MAG: hypothetical protein H3C41_04590 [Bacteroidales bacterium]|nr:hypothetical protein [Bacteroidales bacterium]
MTKQLIYRNLIALVVLILLSGATALTATLFDGSLRHGILLLLAITKVMIVAGFFMELHLAHRFWIFALFCLIAVISAAIFLMA